MSTTPRFMDSTPHEGLGPIQRAFPLRVPANHKPLLQRWSAFLPEKEIIIGIFGWQGAFEQDFVASEMAQWQTKRLLDHPNGPCQHDLSRFVDSRQLFNFVLTAYWTHRADYRLWRNDPSVEEWWTSPDRLSSDHGVWREIMQVPGDRFESLYWADYLGGLSSYEGISLFPTKYNGYYGSMRDRLIASANDPLQAPPSLTPSTLRRPRETANARWVVKVPNNLAMIRSAHSWRLMDGEQLEDYEEKIRPPLGRGMDYLQSHTEETGCLALRWQSKCDREGHESQELFATAFFDCLGNMEAWAESHRTHAAIFAAATKRYKLYGKKNQLRTWHEVAVLPDDREQLFEYINCHAETGMLEFFEGTRLG